MDEDKKYESLETSCQISESENRVTCDNNINGDVDDKTEGKGSFSSLSWRKRLTFLQMALSNMAFGVAFGMPLTFFVVVVSVCECACVCVCVFIKLLWTFKQQKTAKQLYFQ